jgi:quercetin dioxygenase-like cupin family protein
MNAGSIRRQRAHERGALRWERVEPLAYKEEGSAPFRGVTRQVLFADPALGCELRYFEVAPGGHTTLERHEHAHAVVIQHGAGRCLVGREVTRVAPFDLVQVPPLTWHQFRADPDRSLGFLCMVNATRDRPALPDAEALAALRSDPRIAAFLDGERDRRMPAAVGGLEKKAP